MENIALQLQVEEDEWGFGQVLAVFAWVPSYIDLVGWVYNSVDHREGMQMQIFKTPCLAPIPILTALSMILTILPRVSSPLNCYIDVIRHRIKERM